MNTLFRTVTSAMFISITFGAFVLLVTLLRYRRRRRRERARRDRETLACAKCGYSLEGLPVPRCPECGTLRGFTVGIDDLGLTPAERRQVEQGIRPQPPTTPPPPD